MDKKSENVANSILSKVDKILNNNLKSYVTKLHSIVKVIDEYK